MNLRIPSADWRNIIETITVRAFNLIVGVAGIIIIARLLGPEGQGAYAATIVWVGLVATIAGLSLGLVSHYRIQARGKTAWDGAIFGSLLVLLLALSLTASIFVIVAHFLSNGEFFGHLPSSALAVAVLLLPLLIWDEYASNLLASADRIQTYNRLQMGGRSLGLVLLVLFVATLDAGINGALGALVIGQAFIAIGSFAVLWRIHRAPLQIVPDEIRQLIHGALRLHLTTIGAFLLSHSSVLVLNELASKAAVGWYHLSWQMVTVAMIVPQAASLMLYTKIARHNPDRAWPVYKHVTVGVMGFMIVLVPLAYLVGPKIIVYLTGNNFQTSAELFRILLPVLLGMSFAQLMTPQWISRGLFVPSSLITIATAGVHVLATIALVKSNGVIGAAWATALTLGIAPLLVQGYFAWWCEKQYRRSQTGVV